VDVVALFEILSLAFFGRAFAPFPRPVDRAIRSTPGADQLVGEIHSDVSTYRETTAIISKVVRLARMIHPHLEAGE
jgi:hypothetical protein